MYGYSEQLDAWFLDYGGKCAPLPGVVWVAGRIAPLYDGKPRAAFIIDPEEGAVYVSCLEEIWVWQDKKWPCSHMKGHVTLTAAQIAFANAHGFKLPKDAP